MKPPSCVKMSCLASCAVLFLINGVHAGGPSASNAATDMSLQELLNIQVTTASKTEEKLSDAPGVISVVTKDEMKRFGGNTLKDVLERMPSVSAQTAFFQDRSLIAVRGDQYKVTSGHVLLLCPKQGHFDARPASF